MEYSQTERGGSDIGPSHEPYPHSLPPVGRSSPASQMAGMTSPFPRPILSVRLGAMAPRGRRQRASRCIVSQKRYYLPAVRFSTTEISLRNCPILFLAFTTKILVLIKSDAGGQRSHDRF